VDRQSQEETLTGSTPTAGGRRSGISTARPRPTRWWTTARPARTCSTTGDELRLVRRSATPVHLRLVGRERDHVHQAATSAYCQGEPEIQKALKNVMALDPTRPAMTTAATPAARPAADLRQPLPRIPMRDYRRGYTMAGPSAAHPRTGTRGARRQALFCGESFFGRGSSPPPTPRWRRRGVPGWQGRGARRPVRQDVGRGYRCTASPASSSGYGPTAPTCNTTRSSRSASSAASGTTPSAPARS